MFTLVGGRSVAIIRPVWSREPEDGLYLHYRNIKSSRGVIIGPLPRRDEEPIGLQARRPGLRRPYVIVEYSDKAMYAAKIGGKMRLKKWKRVDLTSYIPKPR